MYQFQCDYTGGCCRRILEKLVQTNPLELPGYCEDSLCAEAESLILKKAGLNKEEADVFGLPLVLCQPLFADYGYGCK